MSKKGLNFKTKVHAQHMENGPVPDTADFIQKMEQVTGQGLPTFDGIH